ncbi:unnamed protein product [Rotaria socialis]|uniref:Thioredoxin domain-containing protein n=1 Tax=Rotaria socialis TaxID=392032 RepID=A0A821IW69_9BILA|nr:unnamed protein product [Rotaria socialis]CAF3386291.1 unnamed protein product [Rotaria socialis]CAF3404926.1 unnamed protein product [Rotaria socialis]CAF3436457.1 unnamed protein product [Rotaria socialis]CAF3637940.1 unnamed protein product [Rotaria socialis]
MHQYSFITVIIFVLFNICYVWSGAIQITSSNIDSVLSSHQVVFINFYANWCRFSQMLNPVYDQLADKVSNEYSEQGLVAIGKIDCDSESSISTKYHVNKYPTLKLFRHGILTKREYRGARQIDALYEFIRKQVESSIIKLSSRNDLSGLDSKKSYIIGHFNGEKSENYKTFSKVSNLLRDECHFAASTNLEEFQTERPTNDLIYYRSLQSLNKKDEFYIGLMNNHESFYVWSNEKCVPLVREITFENAEELTDEGLPFLILFHHADDHQSVSLFEREVAKQLIHETSNINCLHADGAKFVHPLQHLGKTAADLPLIVIDSFRHMFLFPDIKQISVNGKLLQFVQDLHSGKLHQDFHNPPPSTKQTKIQDNVDSAVTGFLKSNPPESVFVRLTPSRQRYSFRDEL